MSNRDFKSAPRAARGRAQTSNKSSGKGSGGGLMAGILVGLIIGVAAVVGAVMYFNRASTPFTNLQKLDRRSQPASAAAATEVLAPGVSSKLTDQPPGGQASQVLSQPPAPNSPVSPLPSSPEGSAPAGKSKTPSSQDGSQSQQEFDFYKILPGKLDAVPGQSAPTPVPSAVAKSFWLQVGAFQHEGEADNLKAKLALLGVEAKIQSVNMPDKGLLHRVRVGPFSRADELERVRGQLKQNGLDASVVKADNS